MGSAKSNNLVLNCRKSKNVVKLWSSSREVHFGSNVCLLVIARMGVGDGRRDGQHDKTARFVSSRPASPEFCPIISFKET